jgi:hypothetical protein
MSRPSATLPVRPQDLFGEDSTFEEAQKIYRQLALETHPDRLPMDASEEELAEATAAFMQVTAMWRIARDMFDRNAWAEPGLSGLTVKSKKREHLIGVRLERGDIADIYSCGAGVIKIARSPRDGDLMRREVTAIKKIRRDADLENHVYLPRLIDALRIKDSSRVERQANVFDGMLVNRPENGGQWATLADVIAAYPNGIDPRDAAWIWRRLLVAIGIAHDAGIVHHAVFPEHVMILPPEHGIVLVDWCYSAELGSAPVAVVPRYREWYPEEVTAKEPSLTETDIALAARTMIAAMGGDPVSGTLPVSVPRGMRSYFRACTLKYASQRPGDARRLTESFDDLIEKLWGPRRFREFVLPTNARKRTERV